MMDKELQEKVSLDIASYIINYGISINKPINHIQLQAIMWTLHNENLKQGGEVILKEPFEAWKKMPILRSVYEKYGVHGYVCIEIKQNHVDIDKLNEENLVEVFERWYDVTAEIIIEVLHAEPVLRNVALKDKISKELIEHQHLLIDMNNEKWIKCMNIFIKDNEMLDMNNISKEDIEKRYTTCFSLLNKLPMSKTVSNVWYKEDREKLIEIFQKLKQEYNKR